MKALIIYDNFACAANASATLQHAAYRANIGSHCDIKPWRLDVLRLPSAADEALLEAADADLIVFAGPQACSLPTWLKEWLDCWVTRRQVEEAALAVIHDRSARGLTAPAALELSRFASRHGLSFIIAKDTPPEGQSAANCGGPTARITARSS